MPFHEIAGVIGRRLDLPSASTAEDEADAHFDWFSRFARIDEPTSSAKTQRELA